MSRFQVLIIGLILSLSSSAQMVKLESQTLAGTNQQLPFWLWANQLGRYDRTSNLIQHFGLTAAYQSAINDSDFGYALAADLDVLLSDKSSIRFTELYGGLHWKILELKAGAFAEKEKYLGLSASNGNLASTRNARPHPKVRAGFNRFVPLFAKWFSIYGFYEEGLLNDERFVENTHLHRKAFYFRFGTPENFSFTGGMEHYVMWGGTHPTYGKLPGWESYFDYVLSRAGGSSALPTDQANKMGNQFGTYQVEINKNWKDFTTTLFISHPYEDQSGLELVNYRDNLYGIFLKLKRKQALVESMLLEYYYTKHQSGASHMVDQGDGTNSGRGRDNYFNHGIYRSGVTYHGFAQVSPFWVPVKMENDISTGFESTRFKGIHAGASGSISNALLWRAMFSCLKHSGNYNHEGEDSFIPERKLFAAMGAINWNANKLPLNLEFVFSADRENIYEAKTKSHLGAKIKIAWQITSN